MKKFITYKIKSAMESYQENENSVTLAQSAQELFNAKCAKFDPLWVQVLINLRMKHSKMFTRRRNSASEGWKLVYEELRESGAPDYVSITKIKKKWMNLMTRYRQIKNTTLNPETITWPYFEQMDRAFGRESDIESDYKSGNSLTHSISNDERQNFIKKLIELRYDHRQLFTGRKYTARDGWMIIQSLLQCQSKYSIDQLSKCWQNLVQRYKQLAKHEDTENITWPYFEYMHKWFRDDRGSPENLKIDTELLENLKKGENTGKKDDEFANRLQYLSKRDVSTDCIQLIREIKIAQENNHKNVMELLKDISFQINNVTVDASSLITNNDSV